MWAEPIGKAPVTARAAARPSSLPEPGVVWALWDRKGLILLLGLLGTLAAFFGSELLTPRYTASAQLLVDPRDLQTLGKGALQSSVASDSGISIVESQVQVLTSDNVLRRVIDQLDLVNDPEFNGKRRNPLAPLGTWLLEKLPIDLSEKHLDKTSDPQQMALQTLARQLFVKRPERTFIIDLTVYTNDRAKSIRVAEAIMKAYLEDQQKYRAEANKNTAQAIEVGLGPLRQKLSDSEKRVAAYKVEKNLVGASGRLVTEQQLSEVSNQLMAARADTSRAKARFDETQASRGNPDSIPEAVASASLRGLRAQLANTAAQRARLSVQMLPGHPAMIQVDEQEREVKRQIQAELNRVINAAKHEYERTKAAEEALARSVETLRQQMNTSNTAQIMLRELEREVETNRALYDQANGRARETEQQAGIDTTNARIISAANAPVDRAFPPRKSILVPAGLGAGLALGLFGALAAYQLRRRPAPLEEEVDAPIAAPPAARKASAVATAVKPQPASASAIASAGQVATPETGAFVFADLRGACKTAADGGEVPRGTGSRIVDLALTVVRTPMAPFARRMKSLYNLLSQAQLQRPRDASGPMAVVLTSEGDNEVKSAVALGLAYAAVAKQQRVLLVDGDFKNRRLSSALPEKHDSGVEDVIAGRSKLEDAVVVRPDSQLEFLPSLGRDAARQPLILNASTVRRLLAQSTAYDLVIFESPALGSPGLGQTFAEGFDDMLLVLGVAPKNENELVEAMHLLRRAAPKFRGVVVTD